VKPKVEAHGKERDMRKNLFASRKVQPQGQRSGRGLLQTIRVSSETELIRGNGGAVGVLPVGRRFGGDFEEQGLAFL